jgi:DNA-binding beta-propeller fold protein YncE
MFQRKTYFPFLLACTFVLLLGSCRQDIVIWPSEQDWVGEVMDDTPIRGFYLLNEGTYPTNNSSLDFYDYTSATYTHNIYSATNPSAVMGLGDIGNSLKIHGSRLWAVINGSNKVEVMEATSARRIGQVDIANPRHICFHQGYAYVTSFAGPMVSELLYEQLGLVVKIDTATLEKVDTCIVGYQPEGLDIVGDKIYVANSGGYLYPNYDNTISVISLESFREEKRISVAPNLKQVIADASGKLWVSSLGNYFDQSSSLFCISEVDETPIVQPVLLNPGQSLPVFDMTLVGDSLYVLSNDFSYVTEAHPHTYAIVNTRTASVASSHFIVDGTHQDIIAPYAVAVHPTTRDIIIADARNYMGPGTLFYYSPEGILKWKVRTGDIPGHVAFLSR